MDARFQGEQPWEEYLEAGTGPNPSSVSWVRYETVRSYSSTPYSGSVPRFVEWLREQSSLLKIAAAGEKVELPVLSYVTLDSGRRVDDNFSAAYVLWFDNDKAGDWTKLVAWAQEHGVTCVLKRSASRRSNSFHVGFPLARPVTRGDLGSPKDWKLRYHHLAALIGRAAGFAGLGGNCGFDLATDGLAQSFLLACRRSEDEGPAEVVYVEGRRSLDFFALCEATGFDAEAAAEASVPALQRERERLRGSAGTSRSERREAPTAWWEWGPLGQALQTAGLIGKQKDSAGWHATCLFSERHSSRKAEGYAIYYPSSDTYWCPSPGCLAQHHAGQRADETLERLPAHARSVYYAIRDQRLSPFRSPLETLAWTELAPATPVWDDSLWGGVMAWLDAESKRRGSLFDPRDLARSLVGAVTLKGLSLDVDVLRELASRVAGSVVAGDQIVTKVLSARRRGGRVAGFGLLQRMTSPRSRAELAGALRTLADTPEWREVVKSIGGSSVLDPDTSAWLRRSADRFGTHEESLGATYVRPAVCCRLADKVYADGEHVKTSVLVCESPGCGACWPKRVAAELEMVAAAWPEDGRYRYVRIELADESGLDGIKNYVRTLRGSQRLMLHGRSEAGSPVVLLLGVGGEFLPVHAGLTAALERGMAGVESWAGGALEGREEAVELAGEIRQSLYYHHGGLIHARDEAGLLAWCEWLRPDMGGGRRGVQRLASRTKEGLYWPSREAIREHMRDDSDTVDLSEATHVRFDLHDVQTDWLIHRSERRHSIKNAWALSRRNADFQTVLRLHSEPDDPDQAAADNGYIEAMNRARRAGLNLTAYTLPALE